MNRPSNVRVRSAVKARALLRQRPVITARSPLELFVASASMIGGIAAAISAFLSYQQMSMMNEQRLTPFQVAEYTEQLQQYRLIDAAISDFISSGIAIRSSARELTRSDLPPELHRSLHRVLRNTTAERLKQSYQLRRTLSDNSSFWSAESLNLIASVITATGEDDKSNYCIKFLTDRQAVDCVNNRRTITFDLRRRLLSSLRGDMKAAQSGRGDKASVAP